jgi:hypothetical protein
MYLSVKWLYEDLVQLVEGLEEGLGEKDSLRMDLFWRTFDANLSPLRIHPSDVLDFATREWGKRLSPWFLAATAARHLSARAEQIHWSDDYYLKVRALIGRLDEVAGKLIELGEEQAQVSIA